MLIRSAATRALRTASARTPTLSAESSVRLARSMGVRAMSALATNARSAGDSSSSAAADNRHLLAAASVFGLMAATAATASSISSNTSMEAAAKARPAQTIKADPNGVTPKERGEHLKPEFNHPPPRPDLPTYSMEEVAEHAEENDMWYTFRGGVYDLSFFLNGHPGGAPRLMMAAGQDLEPYWEVYRQHFRGHVVDWMEKYRIGNLPPEEVEKAADFEFGDMFETDPKRHPDLLPAQLKPFNGEPKIERLTEGYITPNELFYTRCHLAVPDICPEEYRLIITGKDMKKHKFTLEDLKKLPKHEVITTLQCAGNRREDLHDRNHKIFISPHWVIGAMSTAKWGGVKLRDVLKECGIDVDSIALGKEEFPGGVKHVQLEGYDQDETGYTYGGSFPIEKAVDPLGEVILAYEMNGEELPRDHGYPVRMIIPGHVGARQVKWLHKIRLSNKPSTKSYQCKSYLGFAPDITFEKDLAEWPPKRLDQGPIIHEQPVTSFVCNPPQNATIGGKGRKEISFKGVAWSGGGRKIERVDVSIDGGKTWTAAELFKPIEQRYNHHWAWTQFHKTLPLPKEAQEKLDRGEKVELDIVSKALDSAFNVQPENMDPYWNPRGIAINHWYHVKTEVDPNLEQDEVVHHELEKGFANTPSGGKFERAWGMAGWYLDPDHKSDPKMAKGLQHSKH
eukprot:CAMPEP_0119554022 /NCGR_PEP_ID=MMETSP1352-20130426/6614_1 /TAXON_ID=265584 /ORGANISM="Stauroneis constricta, Strain CCMP1120" /LENGTH=678 /DNA_ID=CAMNT_0007600537 /DNA_START=94 /DNA_END=2130 /DNA_ORIENTATION=-